MVVLALCDSISVYIGPFLRERERKKKMTDERKSEQTPLSAPTASAGGPCSTLTQINRTPRHWKFTQHHRTTRPPLNLFLEFREYMYLWSRFFSSRASFQRFIHSNIAQWKEKEKEADRRRGGKTISKNGQEWTLPAQLGQLKTGQDGTGLLRIHLWCPDDLPRLWDRIE